RINRHIEQCDICGERKKLELRPEALLGALPILLLPAGLRAKVMHLVGYSVQPQPPTQRQSNTGSSGSGASSSSSSSSASESSSSAAESGSGASSLSGAAVGGSIESASEYCKF